MFAKQGRRGARGVAQWLLAAACGLALAGVFFPDQARAQPYAAGDKVVAIERADVRLPEGKVDEVWPGLVLVVEHTQGQFLWVNNVSPGWLHQRSVIPLNRAAVERFTALIRDNPKEGDLYAGRASVNRDLGDLDAAISDLTQAIRLQPEESDNYNNRGLVWQAKGELDRARTDLDRAIRLAPEWAMPYFNRGTVWADKEEPDRAIADYTEALRLEPRMASAFSYRGEAWLVKGDNRRAVSDLTEALRLDPKDKWSYYARGKAQQGLGLWSLALRDFRQAVKLDPEYLDGLDGLAWLLAACPDAAIRNGSEAVSLARRGCELTNWKDWALLGTLAAAYAEQGDFTRAVQMQEKALELAPEGQWLDREELLDLFEDGEPVRLETPQP